MIIDGDSHFMEPLDLFERYTEAKYRERAVRVGKDPKTGNSALLVDGATMMYTDSGDLIGALVGYGQKEAGASLDTFDRYLATNDQWQDMGARVEFLTSEGFDAQVIYPSLGLIWEGNVGDAHLAAALCRAYNSWAFEITADHRNCLFPAAHISLRDSNLAVLEMQRVAKLGCRTIFVGAAPVDGKSFGHPKLDPVWAAAQDLDLSVGIHLVGHPQYTGHQWYRDEQPGFMFITMNVIQDPRMALTTMVYDGVFERFADLRVATIEAMAGWVGEWLERLDYRFQYMAETSGMKRSAREYFDRNIWICGDPEEKMLRHVVEFAGDEKFFIGSDYPHAEGFLHPIETARKVLSALPADSVTRIIERNANDFYRISS
ncbi:MAG: amidohydrolase family protein [Pseudomonadales bacterium]